MPQLERTPEEQAYIDSTTYLPPKQDYKRGNYEALAISVNSIAALNLKGEVYNQPSTEAAHAGDPYSKDKVQKKLESSGYSPDVVLEVMQSQTSNWNEVDKKASYLSELEKASKQVGDQFSTAGMLAAGIPLALFDLDALLINPSLKVTAALAKTMNLSSRVAKVASTAGTGALVGAESMLTYEAVTGSYKDNSLVESAIMGMALGGTLGFFTSKAAQQDSLTQTLDTATNTPLSKDQVKVEQLATVNKEISDIDEVLAEVQTLKTEQSQVATDLSQTKTADRAAAITEAKLQKELLGVDKEKARTAWKEGLGEKNKTVAELNNIKTTRIEAVDIVDKTKALRAQAESFKSELKFTMTEMKPIKKKIADFDKQLEKIKGVYNDSTKTQRALLKDLRSGQKALLAKLEASATLKNKEIAKASSATPLLIKQQTATVSALFKQEREGIKRLDTLDKSIKEKKAAHTKLVAEHRAFPISTTKAKVTDSPAAADLRQTLAAYGADLSSEGLKKILRKKESLQADLKSMEGDNFNLSTLYGIKKVKQNYIEKLNRELADVEAVKDFRHSDTFKKLPEWTKKLMISPIEHNLNSANNFVSGFSSQLHSGTIHHGKVDTMTAWVLKKMHDKDLSRMHAALTYAHKKAVSEGYTGKALEFEAEVATNTNRVIGQIQRDMFTGIDGAIIGLERFKVAQSKEGSITRNHTSENKWVNKATDDVLNYYESIHSKGKKLGLDAFTGSLGRGYMNRIYSRDKILEVGRDNSIEIITKAQENFARATNSELTDVVMAEFRAKATTAVDSALSKEYKARQITRELGIPRQSTTTSLKQRGIDVFDDEIVDILDNNIRATSHIYALNVHGRLALKEKLGVDNDEQLNQVIQQLGATPRELDNIRAIVETIKGIREISRNPYDPFTQAVKMASSYSSVMHSMAFGVSTVTEVASVAKEFGWSKTIDTLMGTPKEVYSLYKYGTPSEKNSIELMVSYGDAHFSTKANRFESDSTFDSVTPIQEFLDGIVRKESIFSGLLPITDMLRMTSTVLSVDFMAGLSVAKKISKTDIKRLEDMGFGVEDLPQIRDTLKVDAAGRIGNSDRKTWGALDDKITAGVMTMTERTILDPNGISLPLFMTNMNEGQFLPRIMFKFMRFPFESYERMLVRGMQEPDAKQLLAFGGNIAMWTAVLAAKDALKPEDKQQYTGSDGLDKLMIASLLQNYATALPIAMADTAVGLTTGKNLTNDYRYRIGGVVQSDYQNLISGNPKVTVPFKTLNLGDGVASALKDIQWLEELNRGNER
jgi:hypothetical protein